MHKYELIFGKQQFQYLIDIDSLSLHSIPTINVHPYGCYVAKFVKEGLFYITAHKF